MQEEMVNVEREQDKACTTSDRLTISIKKKTLKIAVAVVSAVVLLAIIIATPLLVMNRPRYGTPSRSYWDRSMEFDPNMAAATLQKPADRDFVVLNLTDLQVSTFNDTVFDRKELRKNIDEVVEKANPDLITVTGDLFWLDFSYNAAKDVIKLLDSYGIPWAPVFGNHDPEHIDKNWVAERFIEAENCIFQKGPYTIFGVGNYFINITDTAGNIIHTLFMLDSGSNRTYTEYNDDNGNFIEQEFYMYYDEYTGAQNEGIDGQTKERRQIGADYDHIKRDQMDWYEWVVNGIEETSDKAEIESSAFFHIALPEYYFAYQEWREAGFPQQYNGAATFGRNEEDVYCAKINSGFFDVLKANNTKNVVVGHDHVNYSSLVYQGVRLTYGLKTGDRCYYSEGINGGTKLTIDAAGNMTTQHIFIAEQYGRCAGSGI